MFLTDHKKTKQFKVCQEKESKDYDLSRVTSISLIKFISLEVHIVA